jgi:hypothetical protein
MTKLELIKHINGLRKSNKNAWVYWNGIYNGHTVSYKAYKTWVQYLTIDGVKHSSVMGLNVKGFNNFLSECLR